MTVFTRLTELPFPASEVYAWHTRPGALERLLPPWQDVRVLEGPGHSGGGIHEGAVIEMELRAGPLRVPWKATHRGFREGREFTDVQAKGPFKSWRHWHRFLDANGGGCLVSDRVEFELRLHPFSAALGSGLARRPLARMFAFREARLREDLARHAEFAGRPRMKVAISGGGGVVGRALRSFLTTGGHRVIRLTRRRPRPGSGEVFWDPAAGVIDAGALDGLDAVVHLSGEGLTGSRWTKDKKREIVRSRLKSTELLARTLRGLGRPPPVFLSASAVGYYGGREPDCVCGEDQDCGDGFLPKLCADWEERADLAETAGVRVVHLRIGVVLTTAGGALAQMKTPFSLGLGAVAGNGEQVVSWAGLDDVVYAIHHLMQSPGASGPVNVVSPRPATNRELSETLARVFRRPLFLRLPARAIRLFYGEMGETLLLEGARAAPTALRSLGYRFARPRLEDVLKMELGRFDA